jgi:hypothetical protein
MTNGNTVVNFRSNTSQSTSWINNTSDSYTGAVYPPPDVYLRHTNSVTGFTDMTYTWGVAYGGLVEIYPLRAGNAGCSGWYNTTTESSDGAWLGDNIAKNFGIIYYYNEQTINFPNIALPGNAGNAILGYTYIAGGSTIGKLYGNIDNTPFLAPVFVVYYWFTPQGSYTYFPNYYPTSVINNGNYPHPSGEFLTTFGCSSDTTNGVSYTGSVTIESNYYNAQVVVSSPANGLVNGTQYSPTVTATNGGALTKASITLSVPSRGIYGNSVSVSFYFTKTGKPNSQIYTLTYTDQGSYTTTPIHDR